MHLPTSTDNLLLSVMEFTQRLTIGQHAENKRLPSALNVTSTPYLLLRHRHHQRKGSRKIIAPEAINGYSKTVVRTQQGI